MPSFIDHVTYGNTVETMFASKSFDLRNDVAYRKSFRNWSGLQGRYRYTPFCDRYFFTSCDPSQKLRQMSFGFIGSDCLHYTPLSIIHFERV
jgi:hypothetical protein